MVQEIYKRTCYSKWARYYVALSSQIRISSHNFVFHSYWLSILDNWSSHSNATHIHNWNKREKGALFRAAPFANTKLACKHHGKAEVLGQPYSFISVHWRTRYRENEEIREQFKGLSFKILFTVPVHSSTEKEFIVCPKLHFLLFSLLIFYSGICSWTPYGKRLRYAN